MKIAVTYLNGLIFQHFGHSEYFKLYDVEDGKVIKSEVVSTNGQGHGALGSFLRANNVDVLICGGIGGGAKMALAQAGIQLFGGCMGPADAAVDAFINNKLAFNANVECNHHSHADGHSCADHHAHNCGNGTCH